MPKKSLRLLLRAPLRRWIARDVYRCLIMEWDRARQLRAEAPAIDARVQVRPVDWLELKSLSAERGYEISNKFLDGIAGRADVCLGAFVRHELVSYAFFATDSPTAIDDDLCFGFPARWIYVYKTFTLPAWRGKGLARVLLTKSMPRIERWLPQACAPAGFVTLAVSHNQASLRTFARCGFGPALEFPVWSIFSRPWPAASAQANGWKFALGVGARELAAQV